MIFYSVRVLLGCLVCVGLCAPTCHEANLTVRADVCAHTCMLKHLFYTCMHSSMPIWIIISTHTRSPLFSKSKRSHKPLDCLLLLQSRPCSISRVPRTSALAFLITYLDRREATRSTSTGAYQQGSKAQQGKSRKSGT